MQPTNEEAIGTRTGAIMKVHASNYRIEGFTAEVEPCALPPSPGRPRAADRRSGSGTLVDLSRWGCARAERRFRMRCATGRSRDLLRDKLLGGPQVGIIAGRRDLVKRCARNPLKRALRVDKMRLAALEAVLKLYRDPDRLPERLPTLRHFTRGRDAIRADAETLAPQMQTALGDAWVVSVGDMMSQIGSGALPLETLPSAGLAIRPAGRAPGRALDQLAQRFRRLPTPVIGRIAEGRLLLDLRCLDRYEELSSLLPKLGSAA